MDTDRSRFIRQKTKLKWEVGSAINQVGALLISAAKGAVLARLMEGHDWFQSLLLEFRNHELRAGRSLPQSQEENPSVG